MMEVVQYVLPSSHAIISELQKEEADYLETLKQKEKDLLAAREEGKEKEQHSRER